MMVLDDWEVFEFCLHTENRLLLFYEYFLAFESFDVNF